MRMTNQREIILQELQQSCRHLTADELYERVRKRMPRISLATVYRNLETLSVAGMIAKLEISGRQKRFDADTSEHDHIYCMECGRIDNIACDRDLLDGSVAGAAGYRITGCRVEFLGICGACGRANQQAGNGAGRRTYSGSRS